MEPEQVAADPVGRAGVALHGTHEGRVDPAVAPDLGANVHVDDSADEHEGDAEGVDAFDLALEVCEGFGDPRRSHDR